MKTSALLAALALALFAPSLTAEEPPACPMHAAHTKAEAELDQRGDRVMGFDHSRTTHHFRIEPDGGEVLPHRAEHLAKHAVDAGAGEAHVLAVLHSQAGVVQNPE
jgi:hypothetical protein